MTRITAYRVHVHKAPEASETGTRDLLEKPAYDPAHYEFEVTPICVQLADDVRAARSGAGAWLLYRDYHAYGLRLEDALRAGWAREVEAPDTWPAAVSEKDEPAPAEPGKFPSRRSLD